MSPELPRSTARIRFREYDERDSDAVAAMFADDEARSLYPQISERESTDRWIRWNQDNYSQHGFGLWVIEQRGSGVFLGDCGLTHQVVEGSEVLELGYHLMAGQRGTGYSTEAGKACIDYAFERLAAASVCSIVDPDNGPSIGVSSRLHEASRTFTGRDGRSMLLFWSERET